MDHELREAAACGDIKKIQDILIADGSLVNKQHNINGWTALHWAAKRNHEAVVKALLSYGADVNLHTNDGMNPLSLTSESGIKLLLSENASNGAQESGSDHSAERVEANDERFVPSYMKFPPPPTYYFKPTESKTTNKATPNTAAAAAVPSTIDEKPPDNKTSKINSYEDSVDSILVVKARVADSADKDFIEIELPYGKRTYSYLIHLLCEELELTLSGIARVRKLPNTRIRNDNDVKRLKDMQELEVVCSLTHNSSHVQPAITVIQSSVSGHGSMQKNTNLSNGVYY